MPVASEIWARINASPVVAMEETGWRISGEPGWERVARTPAYTYYKVAHGRGFDQATDLVDADFAGTIVHDDWSA